MDEPGHVPSGLRILVVGSDPILRRGVAQFLRLTLSSMSVSEAGSMSEVNEIAVASAWNLIVLDMEGADHLTLLKKLKLALPDVPVLVLNVDPALANANNAIAGGAAGYLSKNSPVREWRIAVETVANGGNYPGHAWSCGRHGS